MAYENTHLWFADSIVKNIKNREITDVIEQNMDYYFIGSIFPDCFGYSKDKNIRDISSYLHGNMSALSNDFIFRFFKICNNSSKCSFIYGYLTHYALDCAIHSSIRKYATSSYLHWHYETLIDQHLNKTHFFEEIIKPELIKELSTNKLLGISNSEIYEALNQQKKYFSVTRNLVAYYIGKMLAKMNIIPVERIAGFYANTNIESKKLPKDMHLEKLISEAIKMAIKLINSAHLFLNKEITQKECAQVIAGHNFDTGKIEIKKK